MNILLLHNRYQFVGGEDAVVAGEQQLLETAGHTVAKLEVSNDQINGLWGAAKTAMGVLYSHASRRAVQDVLQKVQPDVVHVHNFFPLLSPSVYDACIEARVPVVQTLHNYRLGCPNALLFRDGNVCEDCVGRFPWPSVMHGCYRGSRAQTAIVAGMLAFHRLRGTWEDRVDAFIALTDFQKQKLVQMGLPEQKLHVKPNFVHDPGRSPEAGKGDYLLFVGRLVPEKGIQTILRAYGDAKLQIPLKIVGTGPLYEALRRQIRELSLDGIVELVGQVSKDEVLTMMRQARALVLPSTCYEGFPMTIVEAFASGLAVVGSRIGGIASIIKEGETGWLVPPGDSRAWAEALQEAWEDTDGTRARNQRAREAYEANFTPDRAHKQLIALYEHVIRQSSGVYVSAD